VVCPSGVAEIEEGAPAWVAVQNALAKARAVFDVVASDTAAFEAVASDTAAPEAAPRDVAPLDAASPDAAVPDVAVSTPVLGVDTIVVLGGRVFGKPVDEGHARETLRALSGATHTVLSGVALVRGGEELTALACTEVDFRLLGEEMLEWYLATGEWRGRAGGYAIQGAGAVLVREVRGEYENVVGLPVATLLDLYPQILGR
jgi:septum formation protein